MHDKTVRRRRAVLGLLVAASLVLLTASFGGSTALGSIQRGVFEVIAPIQDGASRALTPVRNLFGWAGDTLDAKGENQDLKAEVDGLRQQLARRGDATRERDELRAQLGMNKSLALTDLGPVQARVFSFSTSLFSQTININKGSGDGLRDDQPVMTGAGLVGKVSEVTGGSAQVRLLTDSSFRVSARAEGGLTGVVKPASGNPEDLVMEPGDSNAVKVGEMVTTRGTEPEASRVPSLYPVGIPIGEVTKVDEAGTDAQRVHIKPFVDVRELDHVQILTRTQGADA